MTSKNKVRQPRHARQAGLFVAQGVVSKRLNREVVPSLHIR